MPPPPRPLDVRAATTDDHAELAAVLARAFAADPAMVWLLPGEAGRDRRLRTFFGTEIAHAHANGVVQSTDDHAGAALWLAPGRWRVSTASMVRHGPALLRSLGRRIPAALALHGAMEDAHPGEPHWYLSVLGTDPARQGSGVGGALVSWVTDRCDDEGTGAYLESSKLANVPYYERFGFRVTGEIQVRDSPILYSMWRDPS